MAGVAKGRDGRRTDGDIQILRIIISWVEHPSSEPETSPEKKGKTVPIYVGQ